MYAAAARAVLFAAHRCKCTRAQRDAVWARDAARVRTATLVFGRLAKQIDARTAAGFRGRAPSTVARAVRRRREESSAGGLEPVYARIIFFCQSREQRNTAFPGALVCIGKCCRIAASRIQSKPLRKPAVFCPYLLRPRACPSFRATTRQRRERRFTATAQKCSPRPCAAPLNAAAAL